MSRTGWGGFGQGMELEKGAFLDYALSNDFCRIMKTADGLYAEQCQISLLRWLSVCEL